MVSRSNAGLFWGGAVWGHVSAPGDVTLLAVIYRLFQVSGFNPNLTQWPVVIPYGDSEQPEPVENLEGHQEQGRSPHVGTLLIDPRLALSLAK